MHYSRAKEGITDLVSAKGLCACCVHAVWVRCVRTHSGDECPGDWCGLEICPGECVVIWVRCPRAGFHFFNFQIFNHR